MQRNADRSNDLPRFFTESGVEIPSVTADQMREIDRIAMEETGPNLFQMMENAGRSLALMALDFLGREWRKARITVLAGGGGNGGGGICAARHLANRGIAVSLCLATERLGEVPAQQQGIFQSTRGKEIDPDHLNRTPADLIVDALIGYGLTDAPRGTAVALIGWANGSGTPILSLDLPSGLDAATGVAYGEAIRPQATLTLALPKRGLHPDRTGPLFLADLGIPEETYHRAGVAYTPPFGNRFYIPLVVR
ncbi:NAD(P)H-hydrate epimerase [Nitrospiraceae bacterium HYJII51-Mn-bac16s-1-B09]|uniref:NAD(P)H-hydrate epimerase n=2 Tax=Candidatus Manganitrophus noduliformans TaxID=2606439 RepID=A0A7X6IA84_9BACT|nr:NAD(P)H-hydrate epimerase [Candidatus Manganitrophus noduliformans]